MWPTLMFKDEHYSQKRLTPLITRVSVKKTNLLYRLRKRMRDDGSQLKVVHKPDRLDPLSGVDIG